MRELGFYELVRVVDSHRTRELGVAGEVGVVIGVPPHLIGVEDDPAPSNDSRHQYSISIRATGFALYRDEVEPTGEPVGRESLYDGGSMRVSVEGDDLCAGGETAIGGES